MVDCLSPHLLHRPSNCLYFESVSLLRLEIPFFGILSNLSLSSWSAPSTHSSGGPPPLPQYIGHHVHVVQGAMSHEVVEYTSADDAHTSMPWPFEGVTPGRPFIDLPWSRTTIAKDTDPHRSSVGLVSFIPSLKTPIQSPTSAQAEVLHSFRMHSHTCSHVGTISFRNEPSLLYLCPCRGAPSTSTISIKPSPTGRKYGHSLRNE